MPARNDQANGKQADDGAKGVVGKTRYARTKCGEKGSAQEQVFAPQV